MERLTDKCWRNLDPWECCGQDHFCNRGCYDAGGCNNGCIVPKLYARLAAYEDTGLTPEEAKKIGMEVEAGCVKAIAWKIGLDINRLRKLAEADKEGRLAMQGWIPVTEQLPGNFEYVLCWYEYFRGYQRNGNWGRRSIKRDKRSCSGVDATARSTGRESIGCDERSAG